MWEIDAGIDPAPDRTSTTWADFLRSPAEALLACDFFETLGADMPPRAARRTLIWNQAHLLHALRAFEQFYNCHRPHRGIVNVRPLRTLSEAIPELVAATCLHVRGHDRLGGILHEYRHAA